MLQYSLQSTAAILSVSNKLLQPPLVPAYSHRSKSVTLTAQNDLVYRWLTAGPMRSSRHCRRSRCECIPLMRSSDWPLTTGECALGSSTAQEPATSRQDCSRFFPSRIWKPRLCSRGIPHRLCSMALATPHYQGTYAHLTNSAAMAAAVTPTDN